MDFWGLLEKLNDFYNKYGLFNVGDVSITLNHITNAFLCILISLVFSHFFRRWLKVRILRRFRIDTGLQYALLQFLHYFILGMGVYIGLSVVNLELGALLGLFAFIGVGIGFGLQNIVSNFISGIIILLERPVKVGDRITVEDTWGKVDRIKLRTTVVTTNDNVSIIIPNSKLLENSLINWSYGDPKIRLRIPIGVSYESDIPLVEKTLLGVAAAHEKVMKKPVSFVRLTEYGDSSINLELCCWIPYSKLKDEISSEINFAIWHAFKENQIEIPFPQRDLHIRSSDVILK